METTKKLTVISNQQTVPKRWLNGRVAFNGI